MSDIERIKAAGPKDLELAVQVGDPLSESGRTDMTVDGSGHITARLVREGPSAKKRAATEPLAGEMETTEAQALIHKAMQFEWQRRFPPRPGIPDEAVVVWSLHAKGGERIDARAWLRDVEKDALMAQVLAALRRELERLSKGKLYL